jgi:hypothetical protein
MPKCEISCYAKVEIPQEVDQKLKKYEVTKEYGINSSQAISHINVKQKSNFWRLALPPLSGSMSTTKASLHHQSLLHFFQLNPFAAHYSFTVLLKECNFKEKVQTHYKN